MFSVSIIKHHGKHQANNQKQSTRPPIIQYYLSFNYREFINVQKFTTIIIKFLKMFVKTTTNINTTQKIRKKFHSWNKKSNILKIITSCIWRRIHIFICFEFITQKVYKKYEFSLKSSLKVYKNVTVPDKELEGTEL